LTHNDSLQAGRSRASTPMGRDFPYPIRPVARSTQPPSYTMGTGNFQGIKRPGFVVDLQMSSSDQVKTGQSLLFSLPLCSSSMLYGKPHFGFISLHWIDYCKTCLLSVRLLLTLGQLLDMEGKHFRINRC